MLSVLLAMFCLYKRRKGQVLHKENAGDLAEGDTTLQTSPLKEVDSAERDPQMEEAFNRFTQQ